MEGRLNSIQKSMVQWNAMHPYSAIHVARIRGSLDLPLLQAAINAILQQHSLSLVVLAPGKVTFCSKPVPANPPVLTLADNPDIGRDLVAEMERQLNLPFISPSPSPPEAGFCPFRFLVARASDSFLVGLVYFHAVADAEAVMHLLCAVVGCYFRGGTVDAGEALRLYPQTGLRHWGRYLLAGANKLLAFPGQMSKLRHSHRPPCRDPSNLVNGLHCFTLPPEDLKAALGAARSWEVTLNDLAMALLMQALAPLAAGRAKSKKRRQISLGCIVNLRRDLGLDQGRAYGIFLGSFTVTHAVPDGITVRQLAMDIAEQTARIKARRLYLASPLEFGLARFLFRFFSPARQKKFYGKHYPVWGGITNMNLNRLWSQSDGVLIDYFRAVSTGPITPLALSMTTVGDHANLGLSFRTAVFSRPDIEQMESSFTTHLRKLRSGL